MDVHKRKVNEWTSITSSPPISSYIFLHIGPQIEHCSSNLLLKQLFNDWLWLPQAGLWSAYSQETTVQPHISSRSHRDNIKLIPIESIDCSSLQP